MNKKIILGSFIVVGLTVVIALVGIYKFDYLSSRDGYDVDGNKVIQRDELTTYKHSFEGDDKLCQVNNDCVHVMTECSCDCGTAVNKKYKEKYLQALKEKCKNYQGRMCKMRCNNQVRCVSGQCVLSEKAKHQSHLISPGEFKKKIDSGEYILVDIRTSKEDLDERIPGTNLSLDFYKENFTEQVNKLDKNKKYLYYCRTGHRSGQASELAEKFNFAETYELEGGIVAWKKAGYKTVKGAKNNKKTTWYKPKPGVSWQWQLDGPINVSYDVNLYDIDLFDTPQSAINRLHRDGRQVICYFSAGSWEDWRPDAGKFPKEIIGKKMDDWDEKWLNVTQFQKFAGIMKARMDLAVKKKCDGIEPDNVDGYTNKTGFKITAGDQLKYNKWLASEAHRRGLAIALKNDIEQVGQLVNYFDFAINEQCFEYNECGPLQAFTKQGKAVLGVEYELKKKKFCPQAKAMNFSWLKMSYDLNGGRDGC